MQAVSFVDRLIKQEAQCHHCHNTINDEQTHCHHCSSPVNDEYSRFKQSLNQQQNRAVLMTRLVIGVSIVFSVGFFVTA